MDTNGVTLGSKALSIAKKMRLPDFQRPILQSVCHLKGSDLTLSVQVRAYIGLRDYDKSFVPTLKVRKSVSIF